MEKPNLFTLNREKFLSDGSTLWGGGARGRQEKLSQLRARVLERWKYTAALSSSQVPHSGVDHTVTHKKHPSKDYQGTDRTIPIKDLRNFLKEFDLKDAPNDPQGDFEGRLRLVITICSDAAPGTPSLSLDRARFEDVEEELNLHPSTIQYATRTMTLTSIWQMNDENMYLIMCFPREPAMPFNFISLSYNSKQRATNTLIREIGDFKNDVAFAELISTLQTLESYLAHPLLVPTILLQKFVTELESLIAQNVRSVEDLEFKIKSLSSFKDDMKPMAEREDVTLLLTRLHDTLKMSIKCLDAVRWAKQASGLLTGTGVLYRDYPRHMARTWPSLRDYLRDLTFLTTNLEGDPIMTQQRCQSQIDILNNKLAQEDNFLAARLAVSATRDSSAMKALAVITALFLPASYVATLFSMSMFNWQAGESSAATSGNSTSSSPPDPMVMSNIWIYWAITGPLTVLVLLSWWIWFRVQDAAFKKQLPSKIRGVGKKEGSENDYVTISDEAWIVDPAEEPQVTRMTGRKRRFHRRARDGDHEMGDLARADNDNA